VRQREVRGGFEKRRLGADHPSIGRYRPDQTAQPSRRRVILPRRDGDIRDLVQSEVQRRNRVRTRKELLGSRVMRVISVLTCQQDAGIQQPDRHGEGRWRFTSAATSPP
jgi:hypothetical protein